MKILFICKHNRFRSQIAETYFRKINRNRTIKSYSAGLLIGMFIAKSVKDIGKKLGLKIHGKPKGIKEKLLKEIDLLVIVANDIPESLFEKKVKRMIVWKISDTSQGDMEGIEKISREIMKRVDELNKKLKNKK
jgi:protein-tyrosine-phosphatase